MGFGHILVERSGDFATVATVDAYRLALAGCHCSLVASTRPAEMASSSRW
jgi:hypothetical protein